MITNTHIWPAMHDKRHRFGFNGKEKDDEITGQTGSHLDFGARIYDSRIGRFLSVDKFINDFPSISPYLFACDNPIKYIDFNGNFKVETEGLSDEEVIKVQRFKQIVDNIKIYADAHPEIYDIISQNTGLSVEQIKSDFSPDGGPTISIGLNYIQTAATVNSFKDNKIEWKFTDAAYLSNLSGEDLDVGVISSFLLICHEYTHYGDRKNNDGYITGQGDDDDFTKSTPEPGKAPQVPYSKAKHRGSDTESQILKTKPKMFARKLDGSPDKELKDAIKGSELYKEKKTDTLLPNK
jgi:RHS repeat-associated protein